jgi:hypothetical protein
MASPSAAVPAAAAACKRVAPHQQAMHSLRPTPAATAARCLPACRPGLLPGPQPAVLGALRRGLHLQHNLRAAAAGEALAGQLPVCQTVPIGPTEDACCVGCRTLTHTHTHTQPLCPGRWCLPSIATAPVPALALLQHQKDCKFREQLKQGGCPGRLGGWVAACLPAL